VPYRFGGFLLDYDTRQLLRDDAEVHLSPKAFELLALLVTNRSRAVSKAELLQHLWPETFVEETNVAGLVAEVRRALHDSASDPVFVRTVYGFGYRFVGVTDAAPRNAAAGTDRPRLHLIGDQGEMMLMEGANVIGRGPEVTIQIDAPSVSRRHALILVAGGQATIEDVDSKNGTFVNGVRIATACQLSDGNQITLGRVVLTFRVTTSSSPTATVAAES
jgi:DNA-binding winged helix-turn-helix (wHTH) protein